MKIFFVIFFLNFAGLSIFGIVAAPVIAVNGKATVDFNSYPANENRDTTFELTNRGDKPLRIGKIRNTCGCTENKLQKESLEPGAVSLLKATIKANSLSGPYSKVIYVESDDPQQRFLPLTLVGNAVPLIKVLPADNLYFGTLTIGKTYRYSFDLETTQNNVQAEIHSVNATFQMQAELNRKAETEKGFVLSLTVTPDASAGSQGNMISAVIKIKIVEPTGWLPIIISLRGRLAEVD